MKRSLYRYFDELKWAERFLDGEVFFRSLAYYRDLEDAVRGDEYEGTSTFKPDEGLEVHNQTQGTHFTLPMAFESAVRASEIFVLCTSRSFNLNIAKEFKGVACVEIPNIAKFCGRIQAALPATATFRARRVSYYPQTQGGDPRWALPDIIATSKLDSWKSQDEYRFIFSLTDALGFEKAALRLADRKNRPLPKPEEHLTHTLQIRSLRDFCALYTFPEPELARPPE